VGDDLVDVTVMNQSIPGAAGAIIFTAADLDGFITGRPAAHCPEDRRRGGRLTREVSRVRRCCPDHAGHL
jgi:hypothetical protein